MRQINYSRVAELFQAPFVGFVIYWFLFTPDPNYAVTVLGVAAVVLAIRALAKDFTPTEQVVWILLAIVLCVIEFRAIAKDHAEHDEREAAIRWQDDFNRKQERRQFEELLRQGRGLFAQEQRLTTRTLNTITGGPSFAYLEFNATIGARIPVVVNGGQFPLSGVEARIVDLNRPLPTTIEGVRLQPILKVGDLAPHASWFSPNPILFSEENKGDFNIFLDAKNGFWNEELHVRRLPTRWTNAMRITNWHGTKRLLLCIDKDYPRDFKEPKNWAGTPDPTCSYR